MAIFIKLLAASLDLGAAIEIEGMIVLGGIALAAGIGRHVRRPRTALAV